MKSLLRMMAMALVVFAMTACGSKSATPEKAANTFLKNYQNGDYAALVNQMHFKKDVTDDDRAQFAVLLKGKVGPEIEKKGGIASFDIDETKVAEDGQKAVVNYTLHFGDGSESKDDVKLIFIDGKWMLDTGK
jgi:hypothetical protein